MLKEYFTYYSWKYKLLQIFLEGKWAVNFKMNLYKYSILHFHCLISTLGRHAQMFTLQKII